MPHRNLYFDYLTVAHVVASLDPGELNVWTRLVLHAHEHGSLPADNCALARIGRVGRARYERVDSAFALHFDGKEDGRWSGSTIIEPSPHHRLVTYETRRTASSGNGALERVGGARVNVRDLGDVSWRAAAMAAAVDVLCPKAFKVLWHLRLQVFKYGRLPADQTSFAQVCRVRPATLERMAADVLLHLDLYEDHKA